MGIFTNRATRTAQTEAEKARGAVELLKGQLQELERHHNEVQELLVKDILSLQETTASYKGNDYQTYDDAVQAISDKYRNVADWGCLQTRAIIDLRAAFILGDGMQIINRTETKSEAEAEIAWVEDFLAYNGLDGEMAQEIVKEAEIEGKCAMRIFWDDLAEDPFRGHNGMPSIRFVSYLDKKYTITANPNDYLDYQALSWKATGTSEPVKVEEPEFVYAKFGGRLNNPNDAQPRIMACLTQIDRLDKALRDLREINHLFASQTPDFECATALDAKALLAQLKDTNWKIGKAIAHVGKYALVGPTIEGVSNLIAEIELNVKMISGTTGVPIHYLGLLDLLKNRATGDNTRELVMASTTRDRAIWLAAFNELVEKSMRLYNEKAGTAQKSTEGGRLDPEKVGVTIPLITQDHWTNIQNVLIPAVTAGIVSKEFVAEQIPGVDMDKENERREENEDKELEQAKMDMERMRQDRADAGGEAA